MIRRPDIKGAMDRGLVMKISVPPIEREGGGRKGDEEGPGTAPDRLRTLARSDHDDFVPGSRGRLQLRFNIGPNTAAGRGVERTDVNDPHRRWKAGTER